MPRRIMIIGCSGAGKSTLARELAVRTGLPLIHLDQEYWRAGWVEPDRDQWEAKAAELARRPEWIIDGNYGGTLKARVNAADLVIFLDFPRWLCMFRVLKRAAKGWGRVRPDLAPGCPEKVDWAFLKFVWQWRRNSRQRVLALLSAVPDRVRTLQKPSELREFLDGFSGRSVSERLG